MDERDKDKSPPEEGDGDGLWAYVTRSVRPLWREERAMAERMKGAKQPAPPHRTGKPARPPAAAEGRAETFLDRLLHRSEGTAAPAQHPGAGLDRRTDKQLKRGQMEIEARLDLHGHNRDAAYEVLRHVVAREAERGSRCVLVITGKGRGESP